MKYILPSLLLLLLASGSMYPQAEPADEADTVKTYQIDDIIVTGTRTYRKIIDVPYSVERIDNVQFKFDRKVSVSDVLGSVPGLFLQNRYGNHDVRISIRGFGSRSNSGIRGVRILLDGIPESEPDGQTRIEAIDFQSIGSIEIVKGNSSSLYTNAPGGVINFINDLNFTNSFFINFNEFGSFDLRRNGWKSGVVTDHYKLLTTYSYHHSKGYREHSQDYWHILNTVLETKPDNNSRLRLYGYFVDGLIKLPGSLTREQVEQDLFQPNTRDVGRDAKRITAKGRLGITYESAFGDDRNHEIELTAYGTMKYFERTARTYRIINRNGIGASGRYVNRSYLFDRPNEFSVGSDVFYQYGPIEEYNNINGRKGDLLSGITSEAIGNVGFYFQNTLTLIDQQLDFLLTGRYDKVVFDTKNQILQVQNDIRRFEEFTPKAALNFKVTPTIAAYTSYGLSFDSPAANELDNYPTSSRPNFLLNPDLNPQKSNNFEIGIKGNVVSPAAEFFKYMYFDVTFFNSVIEDEIVPFEVFGDVFYRNSAKTDRTGIEVGTNMDIVQGLRLRAAYTFSDFSYDEYTARTIELDSTGNIQTIDRSFDGNIVPSVPEHNVSFSLSYERRFGELITGFVKGTYLNVSGMYADDRNSDKSEDYQLLNSTVGFDITFDRFSLLLSGGVNNIFDRRYIAFININSATGEFFEAGEPRHFFLGVDLGITL